MTPSGGSGICVGAHERSAADQRQDMSFKLRSEVAVLDQDAGFEVRGQRAVGEVRRADERTASVDDE